MTTQQKNKLYNYVRQVADAYRLRDWSFEIDMDEPDNSNCIASCVPVYCRKLAHIQVRDDFFEKSMEQKRQTITHELTHCHLAAASRWIDRVVQDGEIPKSTHTTFIYNLEYSVDAIADAVAPFMPLPQKLK